MKVWCSAEMPEVARRLAMLAVEEHQAGVAEIPRESCHRVSIVQCSPQLPESYKERQDREW